VAVLKTGSVRTDAILRHSTGSDGALGTLSNLAAIGFRNTRVKRNADRKVTPIRKSPRGDAWELIHHRCSTSRNVQRVRLWFQPAMFTDQGDFGHQSLDNSVVGHDVGPSGHVGPGD
jgi:hypothetical protein